MRLVSVKDLKDGDIIGRDIMSDNDTVLLRSTTRYKQAFGSRLLERGIDTVYVNDSVSEGIEPVELVSLETRRQVSRDVKKEFEHMENYLGFNTMLLEAACGKLIDEVISNNGVCELVNLRVNDDYTYSHCVDVAILSILVCQQLKLPIAQMRDIAMGALLHDIGKTIIPKNILNKPGKLTDEEYEVIRTHSQIGYEMIRDNREISALTKVAILCHHEREDGSGYPLRKEKDLHISAKIVGVCDFYHALLSDRPYRKGFPIPTVMQIARSEALATEVKQAIEGVLAYYPVGSTVLLSNERLAIVETNFVNDVKRPIVRVIYNLKTRQKEVETIHLKRDHSIHIVRRVQ